tara:strand:- start:191 stop:1264 length:1074 start_codon:yes stop_codon:yes gene_type:complete
MNLHDLDALSQKVARALYIIENLKAEKVNLARLLDDSQKSNDALIQEKQILAQEKQTLAQDNLTLNESLEAAEYLVLEHEEKIEALELRMTNLENELSEKTLIIESKSEQDTEKDNLISQAQERLSVMLASLGQLDFVDESSAATNTEASNNPESNTDSEIEEIYFNENAPHIQDDIQEPVFEVEEISSNENIQAESIDFEETRPASENSNIETALFDSVEPNLFASLQIEDTVPGIFTDEPNAELAAEDLLSENSEESMVSEESTEFIPDGPAESTQFQPEVYEKIELHDDSSYEEGAMLEISEPNQEVEVVEVEDWTDDWDEEVAPSVQEAHASSEDVEEDGVVWTGDLQDDTQN